MVPLYDYIHAVVYLHQDLYREFINLLIYQSDMNLWLTVRSHSYPMLIATKHCNQFVWNIQLKVTVEWKLWHEANGNITQIGGHSVWWTFSLVNRVMCYSYITSTCRISLLLTLDLRLHPCSHVMIYYSCLWYNYDILLVLVIYIYHPVRQTECPPICVMF